MSSSGSSRKLFLDIYVKFSQTKGKPSFECLGEDVFFYTTQKPERGKVNTQLLKEVKKRLKGKAENVFLVAGEKSRTKKIMVETTILASKEKIVNMLCEGKITRTR